MSSSAPTATRSAAPTATHRVPGETGIWLFVLADLVVFGIFFVTLLVMRVDDPVVFAAGRETLNQGFGLLNTLIMLTGSLLVVLGVHAAREGRIRASRGLFLAAGASGLAFVGVKAVEWGEKLDAGFTAHTNEFYMTFFVFTAVHLIHVVIGISALLGVRAVVRNGIDDERRRGLVEGGGVYWHMVDLVWLVLYALFYLAI